MLDRDFNSIVDGVLDIVRNWEKRLLDLPVDVITEKRNSQDRTIKQLVGHLIDSASNNHQRMVRLQYNAELIFPDYTQHNDLWIALQHYQDMNWSDLVNLWKFYNLHIVHIIRNIDKSKLDNKWTDFEGNTVTLGNMIDGYLSHLQLHTKEIEEIINS
ncbi:DinB family protein [Dysgonomonas hofstadii]|uniref:DinB family protein n=1 Tax=Dysgonomonas hofstadii TaxID=637886 RepID=UPI00161FDCEA|nr:DinB family protein [Dysgonomonas hofstadii]